MAATATQIVLDTETYALDDWTTLRARYDSHFRSRPDR
jgi:hypothetical protein